MHVPKGWTTRKISEILDRVSEPVSPEPEKYYRQIGIRSHGKGLFHKEAVTGKSLGNKRVFRVHPECLVVNIVFAWEQAIAKTSISETGMIASHRFPMFQPKHGLCSVDYLTYLFKAPRGKYLLGLASPGGAGRNKTLGQNEFSRLNITIPPIEEQQKIAQILSTWDKAIEKLESLITTKQKRKKALMQQLLTDKKRFAGFEGEWGELTIDKAFELITDYVASGSFASLKENVSVYDSEEFAHYVRQTDLAANFRNKNLKYVDKASYDFLKKSNLFSRDILFTNIGDLGKVFYMPALDKPSTIAPNLVVLRVSKRFDSKFVYYLLASDVGQREIHKIKSGTGLPKISKTEFKTMKFRFPSLIEQQKIASVLSAADKEIETHQKELSALKQQKKGLMQQLLTGKKRVKIDEPVNRPQSGRS